jgi:hypothetical protein
VCTPASSAPPLSTPTPCNASALSRGGQPDTTGHWQTSSSFMRQTSCWRREQLTRSECRSEHWRSSSCGVCGTDSCPPSSLDA